MDNKLENKLIERFPEKSTKEILELSSDIREYWVESCLDDVLEAMGMGLLD